MKVDKNTKITDILKEYPWLKEELPKIDDRLKILNNPMAKVMIGKNGESYQTVKLDKVSLFSKHSFWVTSNGDTYVCVYGHSDWSDTRIYKNGKLLYKSDSFRDICVVEE